MILLSQLHKTFQLLHRSLVPPEQQLFFQLLAFAAAADSKELDFPL